MDKIFDLQYVILPGTSPCHFEHQELHDRAYLFWKNFWQDVYKSSDDVVADDFMRQDFVPVVLYKSEIVAMHLYTIFNPKSAAAQEHTYFKTYPREFFNYLDEHGAKKVMSIESLTVDSNWRKSKIGISLGEVLIGSSLRYQSVLNIDANIAPTRNDRGVNKLCYNFGFSCFKSNLDYKGFEIDLVAGFKNKVRLSSDPMVNNIIDHLWASRVDLTNETASNPELQRVA